MNILIIGTGGVGGFYSSLLAKAGAQVSVVTRSDYDHVRQNGIAVQSDELGDWHFKPAAVYRSASEATSKPDCVILCVKMLGGADLPALVRDALGPETAIVLIANGIDVERELAAAFPAHELISGVTFISVTRTAPGKIWHQGAARVVLGDYPNGVSDKTRQLAGLFAASGIKGDVCADIVAERWGKTVWNAVFNPVSVLTGQTVDIIVATAEPFLRATMQEVVQVAAAAGYPLPPGWIDDRIAFSKKMTPYKTSMLVDFEAGRPLETEAILGAPLRAGRKAGVPMPTLEALYALLKMREFKR